MLCIRAICISAHACKGRALFGIIIFYMVAAVRVGREKNGSR